MFFRQYQLACLSLFSYLIGDETTGRAVVVDPQRDVSQYLADADEHGLRIEHIFETHFHADFLSGHLELAAATGAPITFGDGARADFPIEPFADGQRLDLGEVIVEVRATPGHTPESISLVVYEHPDAEPWGVLTGDTLFIGDVGRPDLLASAGWSPDQLARRLHRSLHDRLLTLPDSTRVFPAHGAGSACGKTMAAEAESTIGEQRATNYALRPMSEDAFVEAVTQGQTVAPLYFAFAADANRHRHELLDDEARPPELELAGLEEWARKGAVVIDARPLDVFASGHFRGSINVNLDGRFAESAGVVARPGQPIVVVTDPSRQTEAKVRLARIGFDMVVGTVSTIDQILTERPDLAERSNRLAPFDLAAWRADVPHLQLIDVRNPAEQATGVIEGATGIPLAVLLDRLDGLDQTAPTIVYCASGYRSAVAASLLRAHGFAHVADIFGGYDAWRDADLPTVAPDDLTTVP
jgi:hydroxyacylglutathione hydrolase